MATLEPPLTRSLGSTRRAGERIEESLTHGPAVYLSRGGGRSPDPRWHRVRSGTFYPEHTYPAEYVEAGTPPHHVTAYTVYQAWCGPAVFIGGTHPPVRTGEQIPRGSPWKLCGTCEGRAVGAGHPPLAGRPTRPLIFRPDRLDPPAICPGSARRYGRGPGPHSTWEEISPLVVLCLVCGQETSWWGDRIKRHPPGADLVPGCPRHAWRDLLRVDDRIVCACRTMYADPGEESI